MATDPFLEAVQAVRRHHAGLKPFLLPGETLKRAARNLRRQDAPMASTVAGPDDQDHDLCFLTAGSAVVTQEVDGERPESIRTLAPPTSFGTVGFALRTRRTARVVAMRPSTVFRASPAAFDRIARDSPTVAVGLLRWACLDVVDWLRSSRGGSDTWSRRHAVRADSDRRFTSEPHGREGIPVDGGTQDAVYEILADLPALPGARLRPLAEVLGDKVHLVTVDAGDAILAHRDRDGSLYLLLEGRAAVTSSDGQVLARFRAGGGPEDVLIGEIAFLAQGERSGTVVAETSSVLLEIPRASVGWMLTKHGDLAVALHLALLKTLCRRMTEVDARRTDIATGGHRVR
jgi:CRP-like cAMP-binding protein